MPYNNNELILSLANFMTLLHNEDDNNLAKFAKHQQSNLELND